MQTTNNHTPSPYIPQEAYLYFPKDESQSRNSNTQKQREFFDGNTQFTNDEQLIINEFRSYSQKHNYTLKHLWTDNMILRFLYANNFKMSKTLVSVKEHTTWRETKLPVAIDSELEKVLNSGLLYIHGRDHEFRPIAIFNVYMLDPKKVDVDLITRALTFWFEHMINEWMLPGQIENWIFIADVKGMGVATLALQSIRKLFTYLQDNYKCRLHQLYVLNVTPILYGPWHLIKPFLDEVTVKKIHICKGSIPTGLLDYTNAEQVQEKYGGAAKNATQYWPPVIPSNNYFVTPKDSEALVSEEQYISLYRSGSLEKMRVDHSRVMQRSYSYPPLEGHFASDAKQGSSDSPVDYFSPGLLENNQDADNVDESMNNADCLEYMNETLEQNQRQVVLREFQSSFLADIHSH